MNKKSILFLLFTAVLSFSALAQGHKHLRITEVMIQSGDSVDAGKATGWIELYNSSYGSYAIEKMFITNRKANEIFTPENRTQAAKFNKVGSNDAVLRYLSDTPENSGVFMIPRGDERNTLVGPHMQVVFHADGNIAAGTFHLPFVLTLGQDNYIALYDVDGVLIDQVIVPSGLPAGQSFAFKKEGRLPVADSVFNADNWEFRDGSSIEKAITPGNFNTRMANINVEKFHKGDPHGFVITIIAMAIVFSALALLFLLFKLFGVISDKSTKKSMTPDTSVNGAPASSQNVAPHGDVSAGEEEIAAICMAMFQHFNAHDEESGVLTFKPKPHTAWTSKTALMREWPMRK